RQLQRAALHARDPTPDRLPRLQRVPNIDPRLITHSSRIRLTQLRPRRRRHRRNQTPVRQPDETLTDLRHVRQRPRQDHRLDRLVYVENLILSTSPERYQRLTPRLTHRLTRQVL